MLQTPSDTPDTPDTPDSLDAANTPGKATRDSVGIEPTTRRSVLRHVPFTISICVLVALTLVLFSQIAGAMERSQGPTVVSQGKPVSPPDVRTTGDVATVVARMQIYPTADPRASLMQPVVDRKGYVWFGEMRANKLARLDPHTGEIREWAPPDGGYGLMMSALGPDDAIWFAEENSNYIGRFDPVTERFTTYPLPSYQGRTSQPQHLQFDRAGQLWFTLNRSGKIGRMNPDTGEIRMWQVLPPEGDQASRPYSLAVTPEGKVWFGAALYGGVVGSRDPETGIVTTHHLDRPTAQVTSMVSDTRGNVWFTELQFNRLGHINTRTGEVSELPLPEPVGTSTGNYALDVAPDGAVWISSFDANAIIRYAPDSKKFTFYTLLVAKSVPFGLVAAPDGSIWFTSDGEPNDYIGHIYPSRETR